MKMLTAKKIMTAIKNREYDLHQWHRVTTVNLSHQTGLSQSTCYRYCKKLSEAGLLNKHSFDYQGEDTATCFTVSEAGNNWLGSWRELL